MKKKNLPPVVKQHLYALHNSIYRCYETLRVKSNEDSKLLFGEKVMTEAGAVHPHLPFAEGAYYVPGNPAAGSALTEEDVHFLYVALAEDLEQTAKRLREAVVEYNMLVNIAIETRKDNDDH